MKAKMKAVKKGTPTKGKKGTMKAVSKKVKPRAKGGHYV